MRVFLNSGNEVVVPTPYFMEYRSSVSNHGGSLVGVGLEYAEPEGAFSLFVLPNSYSIN